METSNSEIRFCNSCYWNRYCAKGIEPGENCETYRNEKYFVDV